MLILFLRHSLCLALLLLALAEERLAQDADSMRPQRGFFVERVAGGSHLAAAQAFAWDAQGRAWVLVAGERLLILDVRVDGHRVFADGLRQASAFVISGAGVVLADENGIQQLDLESAESQELLGGLSASGLSISDLVWSLDGHVYGGLVGAGQWSPGEGVSLGPGVFRMRADGSAIEQWARVEAGVSSVDVSWEGEVFFTTPAAQVAHVVLPERALPKGLPAAPPAWQEVFAAPSTALNAYGGGAWPVEFEGSLIVCDAEAGGIQRYGTLAAGSSVRALANGRHSFLNSTDENFHPVAIGGGPGGALYILDARSDGGTLWRMQHASAGSAPEQPIPGMTGKDPLPLVAELSHPNLWRRLHVQRSLEQLDASSEALRALSSQARNSQTPQVQLHALWLGAGGADFLSWCLTNYKASVRCNALAVAEQGFGGGKLRIPPGSILSMVHDASARVRLQALRTWRVSLGASYVSELIRKLPGFRDDYERSLALGIAIAHPLAAQKAIFRARDADSYLGLIGALSDYIAQYAGGREVIETLLGLSAGQASPRLQARVLQALHSHGREREKPWPSPRLSAALRRLGDSDELQVALAALPVAYAWAADQISGSRFETWTARAQETLEGKQADLNLRIAAARALLATPYGREQGLTFGAILLGLELSDEQQRLLVEELAIGSEPQTGAILIRALPQLETSSLKVALDRILADAQWSGQLLDAIEAGSLSPGLLDADRIQSLKFHQVEKISSQAQKVFARGKSDSK